MIFRDALRSLRRDFSRAMFYWLTFVIVNTFFFLFFNFSGTEASGLAFIDSNYLITLVIVLMIAVCSIDIFFANSFFIKTKAKDIGIRLVCGATYVHIASYLLIQTAILLLTALPAAMLLTFVSIPAVNSILANVMNSPLQIKITMDSVMLTGIIVIYLVFWLVMLNLSFAYQNTAGTMMNERNLTRNRGNGGVFALKSSRIGAVFDTILLIGPLIGFWFVPPTVYVVLAVIGIFGFSRFIKSVVQPYCRKISSEKGLENPLSMVLAGFFATDLLVNSMNIMLYIISVILLISLMITAQGKTIETVMIVTAYVTASLLQSMVLMFRASSEYSTRKKYYMTLGQIGFLEDDLKVTTFKEVILFFAFILVVAFLYVGTIFINMVRYAVIGGGTALILMLVLIVPMIIFCIATWRYYSSCVYPLPSGR